MAPLGEQSHHSVWRPYFQGALARCLFTRLSRSRQFSFFQNWKTTTYFHLCVFLEIQFQIIKPLKNVNNKFDHITVEDLLDMF